MPIAKVLAALTLTAALAVGLAACAPAPDPASTTDASDVTIAPDGTSTDGSTALPTPDVVVNGDKVSIDGIVFPAKLGDSGMVDDATAQQMIDAGFTCISPVELLKPQTIPGSMLAADGSVLGAAVATYSSNSAQIVANPSDCTTDDALLLSLAYFKFKDATSAQQFASTADEGGGTVTQPAPGIICGGSSCYAVQDDAVWLVGTNVPQDQNPDISALPGYLQLLLS